mmetsp:Transcript_23361/g.20475  ORF Transcript_23361/g.20475 Transcript_23361/m.20475 type:complete len:115 (+) Transcript_23361:22-366(+)
MGSDCQGHVKCTNCDKICCHCCTAENVSNCDQCGWVRANIAKGAAATAAGITWSTVTAGAGAVAGGAMGTAMACTKNKCSKCGCIEDYHKGIKCGRKDCNGGKHKNGKGPHPRK